MLHKFVGRKEESHAIHGSSYLPFSSFIPTFLYFLSSDSSQSLCCPPLSCPPLLLACLFLFCLCLSFYQMSEIKNELDTLPMRAMLAAAFITYLSAAPEDRRRHCLEKWMAQSGLQSEYTTTNTLGQHTSTSICQLWY